MACVRAPPRKLAAWPISTVSSFLGNRYCCWMASGGNTRSSVGQGQNSKRAALHGPRTLRHNPAMPTATTLFDARNLRKRYGASTVVDGLSFTIAPGECLGVIGPNGAGKTTTIRLCLGLTAADEGEITALGLSMPRDALAIKAQLGVVSQFDSLDPDFTCAENLLVYGRSEEHTS